MSALIPNDVFIVGLSEDGGAYFDTIPDAPYPIPEPIESAEPMISVALHDTVIESLQEEKKFWLQCAIRIFQVAFDRTRQPVGSSVRPYEKSSKMAESMLCEMLLSLVPPPEDPNCPGIIDAVSFRKRASMDDGRTILYFTVVWTSRDARRELRTKWGRFHSDFNDPDNGSEYLLDIKHAVL